MVSASQSGDTDSSSLTTGEDSWRRRLLDMKTTAARTFATPTALITLSLGLAACGSDGPGGPGDGEYFGEDSGDLATVVVNGNSVTYTEPQCEGENKGTSRGELNEDRTLVVWLEGGRFTGDDSLTFTQTSVTISSNQGDPKDDADVFVREDSDAGKAIYAEHEKECADEASEAKQRDKDKTKREADQKARQDEAAADEAAIESMTVAEMAECAGKTETYVKENQDLAEVQGVPITMTPLGVQLKSAGCLDGN